MYDTRDWYPSLSEADLIDLALDDAEDRAARRDEDDDHPSLSAEERNRLFRCA